MAAFSQIREAMVFAFVPPAVIELGTSGGFTVELQDRSGLGHDALLAARNQFLGMAAQDKRLVGCGPTDRRTCRNWPSTSTTPRPARWA